MSKITEFEQKAYDYIKQQGEVQVTNIPKMMWGAIPSLKTAGLVKTYKKPTTPWASKKHTFVKAFEESDL
jgi:oligoendopeptidase F